MACFQIKGGMGSSDYSIDLNSDWIESAINVVSGNEDFSHIFDTKAYDVLNLNFCGKASFFMDVFVCVMILR